MECKNCGAHYKTRELKCPYCDTENIIGKLWKIERTEAELKYEAKRREAGRMVFSPYVVDRIVSRILIVSIAVFVVCFLLCALIFFVADAIHPVYAKLNNDKVQKTMDEYYEAGKLDELYIYMSKYDLVSEENYTYSQAVLVNYNYQNYINHKLEFISMTPEEKDEDEYHLEFSIRDAIDVYHLDNGLYEEPDPRNSELIKAFRNDIMAYWVGVLKMTPEELAVVTNPEYIYYSEINEVVESIKKRRPWDEQEEK